MARRSYQEGTLEWKRDKPTLRFWERVGPDKWVHRRFYLDELLNGDRRPKRIREVIRKKMAEINEANNKPLVSMPTVEEFVNHGWRLYLKSSGVELKETSREVKDSLARRFVVKPFGHKLLNEITVMDMTEFFANLQGKYSDNYRIAIWTMWKSLFDAACDLEVIKVSPLRPKIHRPKKRDVKKPRLTDEQVMAVLRSIKDDYKVMALLIAVTSMRIGEVLALQWADFDESKGELNVAYTLTKHKKRQFAKTVESKKIVQLPPPVVAALRVHKARSAYTSGSNYIFCGSTGEAISHWTAVRKILKPALVAAGIEQVPFLTGFHLFRRSGARLLYELCRDPKMVQEYMRHRNIATTMLYIGEVDYVGSEAMQMMADRLEIPLLVPQEVLTVQ